jgi:hypothetical protein
MTPWSPQLCSKSVIPLRIDSSGKRTRLHDVTARTLDLIEYGYQVTLSSSTRHSWVVWPLQRPSFLSASKVQRHTPLSFFYVFWFHVHSVHVCCISMFSRLVHSACVSDFCIRFLSLCLWMHMSGALWDRTSIRLPSLLLLPHSQLTCSPDDAPHTSSSNISPTCTFSRTQHIHIHIDIFWMIVEWPPSQSGLKQICLSLIFAQLWSTLWHATRHNICFHSLGYVT